MSVNVSVTVALKKFQFLIVRLKCAASGAYALAEWSFNSL